MASNVSLRGWNHSRRLLRARLRKNCIPAAGNPLKVGETGQIAVKRPDPVMFLEYWGKPEATRDKFIGGKFICPHGACFDHAGNIFVVEWVEVGRVSKLRKVA